MNSKDLLLDGVLEQDEWSVRNQRFGSEQQLEVVGWSGKTKGGNKYYILRCNVCAKDSKLFGEAYFRSTKSDLLRGQVPCGCATSPKWSKEQFETLCYRKAKESNYEFYGFVGDWKGAFTKIKVLCKLHGQWQVAVNNFINSNSGCPPCKIEITRKVSTKPDSEMIASFFASGAFHPDTKFWRSDRKTKSKRSVYWYMSCPDCEKQGESDSWSLQKGCRSCDCSKHRQQEAYINWVIDGVNFIAIKFGIASNSEKRAKEQDLKSVFDVRSYLIYRFPSVESCKAAEYECKQTVQCKVVSKQDMPDGYTETTYTYNLDKIIQIYEKNGGCILNEY